MLAGYLATLLLGASYLSIGLYVSARSDNQIVSLISATAVCGAFYLLGNSTITDFFGDQAGEWLRLLGSGSRFDSITRGVIDLRDLYYYVSIIAVFLTLNTYVLEKERWATTEATPHHKQWRIATVLLVANALGANLWLGQISALRVDMTKGDQYSISPATKAYLSQLQEPLLLRGYLSGKTHPLLAPLVPQLKDLMREYQTAGKGKVRVEFVDPQKEPELEQEANQKYGIQPTPFQVADRYQSAIVSSYFNVLVQYGDEYQVLGFRDLIELKANNETDLEVQLCNPGDDNVYAAKLSSFEWPVKNEDWLDKALLADKDIDQIKGPDYVLQKKDDGWQFAADQNAKQDAENLAPQLNLVKAMELAMTFTGLRVLSSVDALPSGENKTVAVEVSSPKGSWTYRLAKAGDQYFISRNDRDVWFSISQLIFDRIAGVDKAQLTLPAAAIEDTAKGTEIKKSP